MEEISEKEPAKERTLGLGSSQDSATVIDGLKEDIYRVIRDKIEIEMLENARVAKTVNLELEVRQLTESLKISRNEEALMRAKVLELEESVGLAVEKEEERARKNNALVGEKKDMEKSIEALTEQRDSLYSVLENKQRELDEANKTRDELEQVKVSQGYEIAGLLGEVSRVRDVMDEMKGSRRELAEKNEQLVSQVQKYRDTVDGVMLEKDNMRKGFEEEKAKVENLELQVAEMKWKLEQDEAKLGRKRREKEKLNKRNKELVRNVDVLMKEKEALQNTLLKAQRENDDMRNKRSSPTEETSLRKKGKFEQSPVQGYIVLESDAAGLRRSKEDNCSPLNSNAPSDPEIVQYPTTSFNDFRKDIAEDCFAANQFWATYDDTNTLPRYYGLVTEVATPFEVKITWLVPDPDDQGEIDWHDAGLPVACGKFELGDSETKTDRLIFSYQIQCIERSGQGSYLIFPKKGETWAIFRDWDIKWSSNPVNLLTDEFKYVEILSDFTQDLGILVAYLVKVNGFLSLFQKTKMNGVNAFLVRHNELYRFSHRIPSYKMTGNERKDVPIGCFELDTAALPDNFFEDGDSTGLV